MAPDARTAGGSSTLRCLVVDDYPDTAESTALALRLYGHEVAVPLDGTQAVHRAVSFQPDLVLLDLAMPRMAGYEAVPKLREVVVPNPVIVAVTGYGREEDRRRCAEADFDLHLLKPLHPDVLERLPLLVGDVGREREQLTRPSMSISSGLRELVWAQLDMAYNYLDLIGTTKLEATRHRCEIKLWRIYDRISALPGIEHFGVEKELKLLKEAAYAIPRGKPQER
jgi:CheY-like chemotaxis protein